MRQRNKDGDNIAFFFFWFWKAVVSANKKHAVDDEKSVVMMFCFLFFFREESKTVGLVLEPEFRVSPTGTVCFFMVIAGSLRFCFCAHNHRNDGTLFLGAVEMIVSLVWWDLDGLIHRLGCVALFEGDNSVRDNFPRMLAGN